MATKFPKAWSRAQLRRLFANIERSDKIPPAVAGMPGRRWWDAFVRLGWDTALSTNAILRLRFDDLNDDGTLSVSDLTDETLSEFMNSVVEQGRNARTANKSHNALCALWRYANRKHFIDTWPDVPELPELKRVPIAWTQSEFQQLLDALNMSKVRNLPAVAGVPAWLWWGSLLITLYDTGARVGSMMQVKRGDYQPELRRLLVRAEYQKHRSDQVFILDQQTATLLNELLQHSESDRLFPWDLTYTSLFIRYGTLLKLAGLPNERGSKFHRIRKTTATMAELHIGPGTATKLLGHSSAAITEKYIDRAQLPEAEMASKFPRPTFGLPDGEFRAERFAADVPLAQVLEIYSERCRRLHGDVIAIGRLRKMIEACEFKTVGDVDLSRLTSYVRSLQDDLTPKTLRDMRSTMQRFVAWLSDRMPNGPGAPSDYAAEEHLPAVLAEAMPTPSELFDVVRQARGEIREKLTRKVELNERCQTILKLLCTDRDFRQIAEEMGISESKVWGAVGRIRNRVGVKTNYGLALWAASNGLAVCDLSKPQGGAA